MIRKLLMVALLVGLLMLAGCTPSGGGSGDGDEARAFCTDNGGTLETRTDAAGSEYETCVLEDGTECVPQLFMDGDCGPDAE